MRIGHLFAALCLISLPAFAGDLVIHSTHHQDAAKAMGVDMPAEDKTSVTWFGKDRMRYESGDEVTIVRTDLKKMWRIDTKAKTYQAIDMPFDLKKYMPEEQYKMMEQFFANVKVTLTPTQETKKIRDWNCTKYTLTISMPMMGDMTQDMWATKDITGDRTAAMEMYVAMQSVMLGGMGGNTLATEMKKVEGFVVLSEQTRGMGRTKFTSKDEVTSIETKDAPEGAYDLPKDFKEIPFDPTADDPMTGRKSKGGGRGEGGGRPPAPEKPKERPPVPQPK